MARGRPCWMASSRMEQMVFHSAICARYEALLKSWIDNIVLQDKSFKSLGQYFVEQLGDSRSKDNGTKFTGLRKVVLFGNQDDFCLEPGRRAIL